MQAQPAGPTLEGEAGPWVKHAFRHTYARLVARLAREFGFHRTQAVEDAVHVAMMTALRAWPRGGMPREPGAWLYRVARNELLDSLRRCTR